MKETFNRWQVLAASTAILLCTGAVYSFSVFAGPLSSSTGWSMSEIMLAFAINSAIGPIPMILGGYLVDKGYVKWTIALGALLFAIFVISLGNLGDTGIASFESVGLMKTTASLNMLFFRAIGCNFLVCLGIWLATTAQDIVGKFFPSIFCVFTFVFAGFEHSIANMFILPTALFFSHDMTLIGVIANILIVTLGNAFGAMIFSLLVHYGFSAKYNA